MNEELLNTIILACSFLGLFGIAEVLYHKVKVGEELTRKFVHIGTGLIALLFPVMLRNHWLVLILCLSFGIILILSIRFNFLQSINTIKRQSVGSMAYPVSVYGCYLAYDYFNGQYSYYYLPILILAICDPIATLTGSKWPFGKYKAGKDKKTLMGSTMFFLSAFILVGLLTFISSEEMSMKIVFQALVISLVATIAEALSTRGYDNITIPASVLMCLIGIEQIA